MTAAVMAPASFISMRAFITTKIRLFRRRPRAVRLPAGLCIIGDIHRRAQGSNLVRLHC